MYTQGNETPFRSEERLLWCTRAQSPVPEFTDPVFAKTSPKRSFSVIENEPFGLVFVKTWSLNSGIELLPSQLGEKTKNIIMGHLGWGVPELNEPGLLPN